MRGSPQAAIDRLHYFRHGETIAHRKLGRKPYLNIAHAFGLVVEAKFVRDALDGLFVAHDRRGIEESFEIFRQILVGILEHQLAQALHGVRGQLDVVLLRELDQRRDAQRSIEVNVKISLRQFADEFVGECGHGCFYFLWQRVR